MITVLSEAGTAVVEPRHARASGDDLWLHGDALTAASGWTLKPEGLCQGEVCVPVPRSDAALYVHDGQVNMAAFWRLLGRPVVHDRAGSSWVLGATAGERAATLTSLHAPDFELPDLDGQQHKLSDYLGKRVFLTTWSSW